jgi:hypothetical protein
MNNAVTGNPCTANGSGISIGSLTLPVASASAPAVPPGNTEENASLVSMTQAAKIQAAAAMGIDTTTVPAVGAGPGSVTAQDIQYLNTALGKAPQKQQWISQFQLCYSIGYQMAAKGRPVGGFSNTISGNQATFYYHTASGPQQVGIVDISTGKLIACSIQLFLDGFVIILEILGCGFIPEEIHEWAVELVNLASCLTSTMSGFLASSMGTADIVTLIVDLALCLMPWLFSILWSCISASWWSFASVVWNAFAGACSGGAYWAYRLVWVGVAVGQLAWDATHSPCQNS